MHNKTDRNITKKTEIYLGADCQQVEVWKKAQKREAEKSF